MLGQPRDLVVARHGVYRDVDAHAVVMREAHGLRQLVGGEVARERTHPEARAREIHRVRTVEHRHSQLFHIARGGEQLRFLSHNSSSLKSSMATGHAAFSVLSRRTGWS